MNVSAEARLDMLVQSGELKFVYVIGLARSSSTIVCRILGSHLDGAVYEPATPATLNRRSHYARTILKAFDRARQQIGTNRPICLAIKDLSLFLDEPAFDRTVARSHHVVFTVREPAAQYASLRKQLAQEFAPLQRVDAVIRHPFEALWMAWYFLVYGRGFIQQASALIGFRWSRLHRLAMAGWNLQSFANLEQQIEQLQAPFTVLDASALRRDPERADVLLRDIAASIATTGARGTVEVPGHSRMLPRSKWAAEALASQRITPEGSRALPNSPPDQFDAALLRITSASYERIAAVAPSFVDAVR